VEGAAVYYMLNILRLTSLPFLHAMWTGIAGYFVGFAARFPGRRGALLLAAFTVPSLLHATYNAFSSSVVGLTVALVTVLALNLYLVKGRDFERLLAVPDRPGA
jgi:RsiW-degrading membrane proteinase PrsW (M82 family)